MKNIAILVPTLNKGGAERVAANMSLEFSKYYNVYTVVHDGRDITYPYGGTLIDLKLPPAKTKLGKVLTMLKRIRALRKIKKDHQIDVTISHLPPSNYVNIFSRRKDSVFCYLHNMKSSPFREKFVSALSDKFICVSECSRQNAVKSFGVSPQKAVTVYNFCDMEPPSRTRQSETIQLVNMGRLTQQKGQWHLLRALKLVADKLGDRVHLKILGDGENREKLERLASDLGIQQHITFAGYCDNPWLEIANSDIFVFSSLWEGLPMALVEAGRCGLPIISTDCDSGCREILAPDTPVDAKTDTIEYARYGVLVPIFTEGDETQLTPTNEEQILADAILELCENKSLRDSYGEKAQLRSQDFYSHNIMNQWKTLIEE